MKTGEKQESQKMQSRQVKAGSHIDAAVASGSGQSLEPNTIDIDPDVQTLYIERIRAGRRRGLCGCGKEKG